MNSIGDKGSPCLNPRWWEIESPGNPLTKTCVDAEESKPQSMRRQRGPKPRCNISSRRKGH
uniref:Uncharacterized protein n=1 Tax=Arundo donax TaxID=35708 RepID=A0A0A8YZU4_ARUDO